MNNTPNSKTPWLGYAFLAYSLLCLFMTFGIIYWLNHTEAFISSQAAKDLARSEVQVEDTTSLYTEESIQIPTNIPALKRNFYKQLLPAINRQNAKIKQQRRQLIKMAERQSEGKSLTLEQQATLETWSLRYRAAEDLTDEALVQELLVRVDVVPPSMALAQAAMESAWGRSRFAKEANNYFGQWCFTPGCGVVPNRRNPGATHEVARFDSLQAAVAAYMLNINSHPAYEQVRLIRAESRSQQQMLDSLKLAQGLEKYSEKGTAYIDDLKGMIRYNKLKQFDPQPTDTSGQPAISADS